MKSFLNLSVYLCAFGVLLAGCGQPNNPFESKTPVRAADHINASFEVSQASAGAKANVIIQKEALDKEFLLQASLIPQTTASMATGLKSRVVAFKKIDGQLYMLEATKGHVITNQLPASLVLARFPIVSESEQGIAFDFNAGMTRLFTQSEWRAHDYEGDEYKADFASSVVELSYVESAAVDTKNRLTIKQIAQVRKTVTGTELVEVRYFLSPYRPDPTYVPKASHDFIQTGFFEVAPQITANGSSVVYASKHQHQKPIQFAISANTPEEYRETVKQGILYWNRAFWDNPITVVEAPEGVTAPDSEYNVIQWVHHDRAGFAYADAQMDPRTGEILHAQAFLTSTFAFSGRVKARQLLKRIESYEKQKVDQFSLKGFGSPPLCDYDIRQAIGDSLRELLSSSATEADFLRVSQDYVRTVVAHEVGHLMGLRHNFAGSLHTENYPISDRAKLMKRYLTEQKLPADVIVSSSVMDYLPFLEDVLVGHMIANTDQILEYDRKAIEALYNSRDYKLSDIPLFCTDSHVGKFVDCNRHDYGASMVEYATSSTEEAIKGLPHTLLEKFIAAKAPLPGARSVDVAAVSFTPDTVASDIFEVRSDLVGSFGSSSQFLSIFRSFPYVSDLNIEAVREKEGEYLTGEVDRVGGLEKVFSQVSSSFYKETLESFEALARSDHYRSGLGLAGQEYEFSDSEIETMTGTVKLLLAKLPKALTEVDLDILSELPDSWKTLEHKLGVGLAMLLWMRTEEYLLETTGEFIEVAAQVPVPKPVAADKKDEKAEDKDNSMLDEEPAKTVPEGYKAVTMKLPTFFYDLKAREKAAVLLEPEDDPKSLDWGFEERKESKVSFLKVLDTACDCDFNTVSPSKITVEDEAQKRAVTRWFLENKKILGKMK